MFTNRSKLFILITAVILLFSCSRPADHKIRRPISLNSDWKTIASDTNQHAFDGFEETSFDDSQWESVDIPHNWDKYHGYLRKLHGNRHGTAWYRKCFTPEKTSEQKRYFLFFEGVSSYATVWVNGRKVGYHAGGRTTFTIDITEAIVFDTLNILAVRADHPANIRDLPWVCGGCSEEWGFSEGSQPMGIFRPVTLIITNDLRIEPFGVHIWNDTDVTEKKAHINICTEIKNYSNRARSLTLINSLISRSGKKVTENVIEFVIDPGATKIIKDNDIEVMNPVLWSPENPCLYTLQSKVLENKKVVDIAETPYGIRWISWPVNRSDSSGQFLLNGKPVFINGIGEYEHMFGNSHAFTGEQIKARVEQVMASGFNAFRDAHQPHNLRYQQYWDHEGLLWWPQMSAHIWFDNQAFRENFKALLRDWVKERRNSPSNIMWGLQNESVLPEEFARECVEIIRELDPTSSSQRIITTCNGGKGTDWNVVQNWSGTYGGNPYNYDKELKVQLLNGEYGAWRSIDLHSEGSFDQQGILSEDRMTQLLQMKIKQAEPIRDHCCGQFLWLLSSHDNPGRIQSGEGLRESDRIGPVNHKGLLTPWGEPLDAFYMYRAHYVDKEKEPMVYIVSHTWPNRWIKAGLKDSITVYSNCDEVELFNDINTLSLGKRKNGGRGTPFLWKKAEIRYNVLQATGYSNGKAMAH
ncbi:MAG: glycoside hydrolase family 2 protein, partial [Bacteroidales bacterium]|nr:glycoside hydrolase family 2 protein [Bacteroidales bacterium]